MAEDNTIIEGTVKFRDGKKWKSRWCVMRKLSPVADCVHLQLYREAGRRAGSGSGCKASLSLQHYLGSEAGFTLDKHSNTLALLCRDLVAVLAFDTRERLIQWQVKVASSLGSARQFLVLVGPAPGGTRARLPRGPARLHLLAGRFTLTAGVPPRALHVWEHKHLRRYGVVEGRFCFEGGSHCGKGEGLHVLITDQAKDIADTFDLAAQGKLSPRRRLFTASKDEGPQSPQSHKAYRPDTRLSELQDQAPLNDRTPCGEPGWRDCVDLGLGDTVSVHEELNSAAIARCRSCMSKLGAGALSRSSTAALTPGARHFAPNWTMDVSPGCTAAASIPWEEERSISRATSTDLCACPERPPERPPKPTTLELNLNKKPPMPLPSCGCLREESAKVGPYENYDVPKLPSAEVDGEYYDTPKRLKDCLNDDLFQITKSSTPNALILKKPCGCLLKFGRRRKEPTVVDSDESCQPPNCPCQKVTDWANNWIRLPYCKRNANVGGDGQTPNKENLKPISTDQSALYATIDLSQKTRRKTPSGDYRDVVTPVELEPQVVDPQSVEIDEGPLANYENLNFALSLEHYENAKDVLKKAGITQTELDAIGASLNPLSFTKKDGKCICKKCGNPSNKSDDRKQSSTSAVADDYLMMEPNILEGNKPEQIGKPLPAGYTPMSPIGGFTFHTLKHPTKSPIAKLLEEKSASNPTLCGVLPHSQGVKVTTAEVHMVRPVDRDPRTEYRKRSSSADSSRFLDDVQEFDGHGSTSSIETLRDPSGCRHKLSDNDSSEAYKRVPPVAVKRSSSVPVAAGNRDSSSSNDSGVSSCSLRPGADFELPLSTGRWHHSSRGTGCRRASLPRRSRSTDPLRDIASHDDSSQAKSSSAEAEVPVLPCKPLRSIVDTHSTTSSGTSDMSDYIETLSICSSHSSTDTPVTMRVIRQTTSTLRPRSGKEYLRFDTRLTGAYRRQRHYSDMPS